MRSAWIPNIRSIVFLGLVVGVFGGAAAVTPFGAALEEDIGLWWLFKVRGPIAPPAEVVIVNVDKSPRELEAEVWLGEAHRQCLRHAHRPRERLWPRCLHADLIRALARRGAAVITYDLTFEDGGEPADNAALVQAMTETRRVVVFERLNVEKLASGAVIRETLIPPIEAVREAAMATGPFPLPKVPARVSQFWAYRSEAREIPALPVAALYVLVRPALGKLVSILDPTDPAQTRLVDLASKFETGRGSGVVAFMRAFREAWKADEGLRNRLLARLESATDQDLSAEERLNLTLLVRTLTGDTNYHLNFYGPPGTLHALEGSEILKQDAMGAAAAEGDLAGKAVFIGAFDLDNPDQRDGFYTVFSTREGIDLSGVEILASAFANLLYDQTLESLTRGEIILVLLAFGFLTGALAASLTGPHSLLAAAVIAVAYFAGAEAIFVRSNLWVPTVIPVLMQIPAAVIIGVILQNLSERRQRARAVHAIEYYVPRDVASALIRSGEPDTIMERVHGVCLSTDAEGYTRLSARLEAGDLKALLDEYFRLLTEPVKEHDGVIIQTTGDSMISLWRCAEHDDAPIERACLSAIDIQVASARFDMIHADQTLRTRIGLHFGQVIVGNVGGSGHFNYTVTGDAVNVAARLEGLNKHVGTSILASGEVVKHARSSFARRLGCFVPVGLEEPISVFEIICRREHASDPLLRSSHDFARALATFETGQHHAAAEQFEVVLQHEMENGPAKFFRDLCHGQLSAQAEVDSAGIIWMKQK